MTYINSSGLELISGTPLVELSALASAIDFPGKLYGKIEGANLTGSMKDRVALAMIQDAEERGELVPGASIIEPTSGNTGIGLAAIGTRLGYQVILVMPDSMSKERQALMEVYGAELVLTPGAQGMQGAIEKAEALKEERPGAIIAGQFDNPANPRAHYESTGPEIWEQCQGRLDALVAGVGTGGSISGCGQYLKEQKPSLQLVAVEPAESAVLSGQSAGIHGIQGIGAGFVPANLDWNLIDAIEAVQTKDAWAMVRQLSQAEAIFAGVSSGAAIVGAMQWAKKSGREDLHLVVLLPDNGMRYLSSPDL